MARGVRGNDAKEAVRVGDERDKAATSVFENYSPSRDDNVGLEICGGAEQPELCGDSAGERVSALGVQRFVSQHGACHFHGLVVPGEAVGNYVLQARRECAPVSCG